MDGEKMSEGGLTPTLDRLRLAEENNFEVSVGRLGETASLVEDFADVYQSLCDLLRETTDPPDHLFSISLLYLSTAYQLEKACLECLRGRLTDAVQITRRGVEAAAFAARIARHPHLGELWFRASVTDGTYDEYRQKFGPAKIFPKDDAFLRRLYERWDQASRQSHTSVYSLSRRAGMQLESGRIEFKFNHFEVHDDDEAEPARALLWILDTHRGILQLFHMIFREQLGPEKLRAWEVRLNALEAKFVAHRERWREVILKSALDEEGEMELSDQ